MLRLNGFSFVFQEVPIVRDVHFSLRKGEYLSIIGPNGAGKSTLLRALLRLHATGRAQGELRIKGRHMGDYSQKDLARIMAYVPQPGGACPPFTVEELLRLSRYPHANAVAPTGNSPADAVRKALALTRMEALARRPLSALSGGERQRASLAAALAQETEMLLLDEPTAFLDPRHCAVVNALLRILHREHGLTMLTVTHDLNHPLRMGGKVLALREGRQVFFGSAQELWQSSVLEETFGHSFVRLRHPVTNAPIILAEE